MDRRNFDIGRQEPIPFSPSPTDIEQKGNTAGGDTTWNTGFPFVTTFRRCNILKKEESPLFKAVCSGDLDATQKFIREHPEAVNARITSDGETALHIAAMFGHLHIVEELVKSMSAEDLVLTDYNGITALHCAVFNTNKKAFKAAKCMVEKSKRLVDIPDKNHWIPITVALEFGHTEMARYLYPLTQPEALNGEIGAFFLNQCYNSMMFDIALRLIKRSPQLVVMEVLGVSNVSELEEKAEVSNFSEQKMKKVVTNFWHTLAVVPPTLREIQPPYSERCLHTCKYNFTCSLHVKLGYGNCE